MPSQMKDAVIIGAGLAGLNCALTLQRAGLEVALIEAADAPGGRVRTDRVDGFLLDRGFQVLLTAYPEAKYALDYESLRLQTLKPGALVWKGGRFHRFADPFREPLAALRLALDPLVTLGDKLRVAKLRGRVLRRPIPELFLREETTTTLFLERFGFSPKIIESFFAPFFGGVFLEKELATSSRYFEFLFRMFSTGMVAVPAEGMEAIPRQLAHKLHPGTLLLNSRVTGIRSQDSDSVVSIEGAPEIGARAVILATEEPEARRLLHGLARPWGLGAPRKWNCTTAFYFATDRLPMKGPILMLNGEGEQGGPVNNAVVMSQVSASYAPPGQHLISASVVGQAPADEAALASQEREVLQQLAHWFGPQVARWRTLGARPIQHALPLQTTVQWETADPQTGVPRLLLCGDYLETSSIQGSLASGRRAAQSLLASPRK